MAAVGDEENDEGVSTLAEYMERVEEQELVLHSPSFPWNLSSLAGFTPVGYAVL